MPEETAVQDVVGNYIRTHCDPDTENKIPLSRRGILNLHLKITLSIV